MARIVLIIVIDPKTVFSGVNLAPNLGSFRLYSHFFSLQYSVSCFYIFQADLNDAARNLKKKVTQFCHINVFLPEQTPAIEDSHRLYKVSIIEVFCFDFLECQQYYGVLS